MDEAAPSRFKGFSSPYYTQVPDILFDELLAELSGAELKVLLYIIRRTFGFKKGSDNISLSQMAGGITAKDGTVIDKGTGLSRETVIRVTRSLEERGMIRKTRRSSTEQGDEATTYELVMEEEGGVRKSDTGGSQKIRQGGVRKSDTQYTVIQYTDFESSNNSKGNKFEKREQKEGSATMVTLSHNPSLYASQSFSELPCDAKVPTLAQQTSRELPGVPAAHHSSKGGFASIGEMLVRRQPAPPKDEAKSTITVFVKDIAAEFNDRAPIKSSVSRACNLFARANVSLEAFMASLFEARSITKDRAREGEVKGKMGYFFSVLGERLGVENARGKGMAI